MKGVRGASLIAVSVIGLAAFIYPFWTAPADGGVPGSEGAAAAPLIFLFLFPAILYLVFGGLLSRGGSKEIALLGALLAINVTLRFIPLPLGGSAIFFLLILAGYTWGASFGFSLGSLSILLSAFWAGGLGPWVPFQMIAAGWVGMSGALFRFKEKTDGSAPSRRFILTLALFGALWGYLFGAIMNLWFWPYLGTASRGAAALRDYGVFYLATSAFWDTGRAAVNFLLLLFLGETVLKVFARFKRRFEVEYK